MKRRARQALPALCSQARNASTAAKLRPLHGTDLKVSVPASNLSKWSRPTHLDAAEAGPSRPPGNPSTPPNRTWSAQNNSLGGTGKWGPGRRDAPPFASTFASRDDRYPQRGERAIPPRPRDPMRPDFSAKPSTPRSGASNREGAPHLSGTTFVRDRPPTPRMDGKPFVRDRPPTPQLRGDAPRVQRESAAQMGRGTFSDRNQPRQTPMLPGGDRNAQAGRTIKKDEGSLEEFDETHLPGDTPTNEADARRSLKGGKDKTNFKTRGSISSQFRGDNVKPGNQVALDRRAVVNKITMEKENQRKRKAKAFTRVTRDVFIPSTVSVGQLARLLNVRMGTLQRKMTSAGMAEESSYDHVLTSEYAALLADEFGRNPIINDEAAFDIYPRAECSDPSSLPSRPPVVTIMGHVDHGKTTLLDTLRSTSVAKGEAGGITQHIGAFSVPVKGDPNDTAPRTITFLDTPGHAAFSAMRARGAGVTDIIVLVVAADDGIMPQTREVIELTKKTEGKVGVVVAINKVDKPGVDVDGVTKALMVEGIQLESYGGDTPGVEVSGLTGLGLENLTETLSAMSELQDLRAEREGQVHGYVLESNVRKGLGPVATVLILRGRLTVASHLIAGTAHAKVRIMNDSNGAAVKEAYPGMAITVSGWKDLPNAGDEVLSGSEPDIKKALANRIRKAEVEASLVDMEAINNQRIQDRKDEAADTTGEPTPRVKVGPKELRLIIKGDVSGSVEAVEGALQDIGNKEAVVKIVSSGVGDVTESDVMMAKAVEGMVIAFSVQVPRAIESKASAQEVSIYSSTIIYRVMEEVRNRVGALLPPIIEQKVTGEANVLELFNINLKGRQTKQVAGCRVTNGLVEKSKKGRVVRDGVTVFDGSLDTMKQGKKDLTEVRKGMECGLSFADFQELQADDLIQMYEVIEKPGVL